MATASYYKHSCGVGRTLRYTVLGRPSLNVKASLSLNYYYLLLYYYNLHCLSFLSIIFPSFIFINGKWKNGGASIVPSVVNILAPSSFFATTTQKLSRERGRRGACWVRWHFFVALTYFSFYQIKSTFFCLTQWEMECPITLMAHISKALLRGEAMDHFDEDIPFTACLLEVF